MDGQALGHSQEWFPGSAESDYSPQVRLQSGDLPSDASWPYRAQTIELVMPAVMCAHRERINSPGFTGLREYSNLQRRRCQTLIDFGAGRFGGLAQPG
jgi:hypothetical protein